MKHADIVNKMSLEQKAAFVSGFDYWHLEEAPELGLPKIMVTDGPHGLRKQNPNGDSVGLGNSYPATCFPTAATSSCSWDEELLRKEGEALGEECLQEEVSVILGPGTNIKRAPVCGRNFEYFSEDPYLAGKCSANIINGVQSKGIGTSLKHFACNSQEAYRMVINEVIDERAMREIYLTAFEIAIKEAQPWTVMNSYNRINGVYASQNGWLQQQVARGEWGFQGLFVTDWGSSVDRIPGLENGTDLEMPSSGDLNTQRIIAAVKEGKLDENVLNERVDNVVNLILKAKKTLDEGKKTYDVDAHHDLACRVAEGSIQLLKNDDGLLPLKKGQKVAVIGEMAKAPRYQGAGSSVINPTKMENAYDNLVELGVDVTYAQGYKKGTEQVDDALVAEALAAAKAADVAVVFAGLTEEFEGEGYDRANIEMPANHNQLIEQVAAANPNTVLTVVSSYPYALGEAKELLPAILYTTHAGPELGNAVADTLLGKNNPAARCPITWYRSAQDLPDIMEYDIISAERTYLYDTVEPLFPFGHGLSYSSFVYRDFTAEEKPEGMLFRLTVENTSQRDGDEVVQLYYRALHPRVKRPLRQLCGFQRVPVPANTAVPVTIFVPWYALEYYDVTQEKMLVEQGEYRFSAGASSADIRQELECTVSGEVIPPRNLSHSICIKNYDSKHGIEITLRFSYRKNDWYGCTNDWGGSFTFADADFAGYIKAELWAAAPCSQAGVAIYAGEQQLGSVEILPSRSMDDFQLYTIPLEPYTGQADLRLEITGMACVYRIQLG